MMDRKSLELVNHLRSLRFIDMRTDTNWIPQYIVRRDENGTFIGQDKVEGKEELNWEEWGGQFRGIGVKVGTDYQCEDFYFD